MYFFNEISDAINTATNFTYNQATDTTTYKTSSQPPPTKKRVFEETPMKKHVADDTTRYQPVATQFQTKDAVVFVEDKPVVENNTTRYKPVDTEFKTSQTPYFAKDQPVIQEELPKAKPPTAQPQETPKATPMKEQPQEELPKAKPQAPAEPKTKPKREKPVILVNVQQAPTQDTSLIERQNEQIIALSQKLDKSNETVLRMILSQNSFENNIKNLTDDISTLEMRNKKTFDEHQLIINAIKNTGSSSVLAPIPTITASPSSMMPAMLLLIPVALLLLKK